MNQPIGRYVFTQSENKHLRELANKEPIADELKFLETAALLSRELPERFQRICHDFKRKEEFVGLHVGNLPLTDADVGPTPMAHRQAGDRRIGYGEWMHGIIAAPLGEAFGYNSQQNGCIFNNIIAFREFGHLANASVSADNDFGFHTEDAYHPFCPDYVSLLCYRNEEGAPTGISSLRGVDIPDAVFDVLSEPGRFRNLPNFAHQGVKAEANQQVLWGDRKNPYLRINVPNVVHAEGDAAAQSALEFLKAALVRNREAVVLKQSELLVIDNVQAVHSRDKFTPIYGPGARWLSRLVLARDLRRSRRCRATPDSRIMLHAA